MTVQLRNILCAIDFSSFTKPVLDMGMALSRRLCAQLIVFHAVDVPKDGLYATDVLERGQNEKKRSAQAAKRIRQLMSDANIAWKPMICIGSPVDEICRVADAGMIDLAIASSHGLSGVKRILLGTVVERLARRLSVPLLVLPRPRPADPGFELNHNPVVAGCMADGRAEPALAFAIGLARLLGKPLHVLHALESPLDKSMIGADPGPYSQVQAALQDNWRRRIDRLARDRAGAFTNIHATVAAGLPGEALVAHAGHVDADLIVVGRKPCGLMKKWLIGSTTENVLRHASSAAVIVP